MGKKSDQAHIIRKILSNEKLTLGIIFLIGLVLRLIYSAEREIFYDDAFSYFLSIRNLEEIISGTAADTMPPLYYFLLHFWAKISESLWFLRSLNVVLNLCAGYFLFLLIRDLNGKNAALVALLFFVISPYQIYHSQELRMYSLLILGQGGFYYFCNKLLISEEPKDKYYIGAVIFGVIAMYSHNLAVFGLVGAAFWGLLRKSKKKFLTLIGIQLLVLLLFIPWGVMLPGQIDKIQTAFWTPRPGLLEIVQSVLTLLSFLPLPPVLTVINAILVFEIIGVVLYYLVKNPYKEHLQIFIVMLIPPMLLFMVSYIMRPVFVPRGFLISAWFFFGLLGSVVVNSWEKVIGRLLLFMYIVVVIISLPFFYTFEAFPRSSFQEVSKFLASREIGNEDIVLHDNKLSFFPTLFYDQTIKQEYLLDPPGSHNDTLALKSQKSMGYEGITFDVVDLKKDIYFIVFQQTINEFEEMGVEHPVINAIDQSIGEPTEQYQFGDLVIFFYDSGT